MQTEKLLVDGLMWLTSAAGLVALVVFRRRSPRATGFALPVVAAMLVVEAAFVLLDLNLGLPQRLWRATIAVTDATPFTHDVGPLLLVVAAMMDRRPAERT